METAHTGDNLPHFQICGCGKHGRVVFPDGRTGGEFASQAQGRLWMEYAALVDAFQNVDIFPEGKLQHLFEEIQISPLPDQIEPDAYILKVVDTWNAAKLHQPSLNPVNFHHVMDRLWDYNAFEQ